MNDKPDKPYHQMADEELRTELTIWEKHVERAGGWASAYFAACQVKAVVAEGNRRGLGMTNKFPIKVG